MAAPEAKLIIIKGEAKSLTFNDILKQFKPLITKFVKKWLHAEYDDLTDYDDLKQYALLGLLKAYSDYNLLYNVEFMTYAYPVIDGILHRHFRDRMRKTEYRGVHIRNIHSLNETLFNGDEDGTPIELGESIESPVNCEEEVLNNTLLRNVKNILDKINPKYWLIVNHYYVQDMTQREIADEFGISQAQISRLLIKRLPNLIKKFIKLESVDWEGNPMDGKFSGRTGGPILSIKREQEYTKKINPTECKTIAKLTPEQLDYYKSLPYEDGKQFLEKVLKGEEVKVIDANQNKENLTTRSIPTSSMPAIMTKENLQADIENGMPINQIARKYGKGWGQVKAILTKYGLWDKRKVFHGGLPKELRHMDSTNIFAGTSASGTVQAEPVQQNASENESAFENTFFESPETILGNKGAMREQIPNNIPSDDIQGQSKPSLVVVSQVLKSEHFEFSVHDEQIDVIEADGEKLTTPIYIQKHLVKPFLNELAAVAEVTGI